MNILHILPRWIGGGPERALIELAKQDALHGWDIQRRVLVLDRPLSAPLLIAARRVGLQLVTGNWRACLPEEVGEADIVVIDYWNHPLMMELLQSEFEPSRIVISSAVAGNTLPQIISQQLAAFPDLWISGCPMGSGALGLNAVPAGLHHIPALADMQRLDGFAPRQHVGIRAAYLGSLELTKLHRRFPELVHMTHESVSFDLIGDASAESIAELRRRLAEVQVSERVTLSGHVEDISTALASADLFAYPLNPKSSATSEKALQEAMWVGLPPVLLAGTASANWIESGRTGVVAPSLLCFAEELGRLSQDESLRQQMGQAARAFAREHFDPAVNCSRLRDLYIQVLDLPKRHRETLHTHAALGAEIFLAAIDSTSSEFNKLMRHTAQLSEPELLLLLHGEGGLIHYHHHYPRDPTLGGWVRECLRHVNFRD